MYRLAEAGRVCVVWPSVYKSMTPKLVGRWFEDLAARLRGGRPATFADWDLGEQRRILDVRSTPSLWEWFRAGCPADRQEPSEAPPPNGTQQGEGEKPKPAAKPDGPFDADGFRFAGIEVRFGKAGKQYRLVMALWDAKKKRPSEPRPVQDVITQVWGDDNDTEDAAFRKLCSDVRARFQSTNCSLDVVHINGMVQLKAL